MYVTAVYANIKEEQSMKAFGIFMIGAMAVAGGIAAATYITKKKIDKENEDNYYDDWDNDNIDDDWDFDFDEDMDVEGEPAFTEEKPASEGTDSAPVTEEKSPFASDIFGVNEETGGSIDEES